jgi:hypothetical protein
VYPASEPLALSRCGEVVRCRDDQNGWTTEHGGGGVEEMGPAHVQFGALYSAGWMVLGCSLLLRSKGAERTDG